MRRRLLRVVCRLRGHDKVTAQLYWAPGHTYPGEYCKRCDWWKWNIATGTKVEIEPETWTVTSRRKK